MSPRVFTEHGYRVVIYPNDHSPAHVHVIHADGKARVKLDPVELVNSWGFNTREIGDILDMIEDHQAELLAKWDELHPGSEE